MADLEEDNVRERKAGHARLFDLLAELAGEVVLEIAGAVTQEVAEEIALRERA